MEQHVIWQYRPPQVVNLGEFLSCLAVIPLPWAWWCHRQVRSWHYVLTAESLHVSHGKLYLHQDEVELYRITDYHIKQPFFHRLFGVANLTLYTNDLTCPVITLKALENPEMVKKLIQEHVDKQQKIKGRIDID